MNISPISNNSNNYNETSFKSIWGKNLSNSFKSIWDRIPMKTFSDGERKIRQFEKACEIIAKPAQNRAITGFGAILLQPTIDRLNRRTDKETREVAFHRTLAKCIIAPTAGILAARWPVQTIVDKMTDLNGKGEYSRALIPKKYLSEISKSPNYLKHYKSAVSTLSALLIMVVTNFAIDAPLTAWLTNLLNENNKYLKAKEKTNE